MYAVRIHVVDDEVTGSAVADFCGALDGAYLMVQETEGCLEATRTHFQGWVFSGLAIGTIRARLKTKFPQCIGNKGYSLKPVDDPAKYIPYCLKGTRRDPPLVVCLYGPTYTDAWVHDNWKVFWEHDLSAAYEHKKKKQSVVETIWEEVDAMETVTLQKVTSTIVDKYTSVGKPFDIYGIRRLRNVIMSKYDSQYRKLIKQQVDMDDIGSAYDLLKIKSGVEPSGEEWF
jgi:hypothetical protein